MEYTVFLKSEFTINGKIINTTNIISSYGIISFNTFINSLINNPIQNINYGLKNQYTPNIMLYYYINKTEWPIIIPHCDFEKPYMEIWVDNQQSSVLSSINFNYKLATVLFTDIYDFDNNRYTFRFSQIAYYKQIYIYKLGLFKFDNLYDYPYDISGYKNNLTMINNVSDQYSLTQQGIKYNSVNENWYIGISLSNFDPITFVLLQLPYMLHSKSLIRNNVNI